MTTTKIVEAVFNGKRTVNTRSLYQYDYGQVLTFPDLITPPAYQVQFCNFGDTETIECIGGADGVAIPDEVLKPGSYINAYVFLHDEETDGETRYSIVIPVNRRPEMSDITPTPSEQTEIDQLINALNDGVNRSESAAASAEKSEAAASASEKTAVESAETAVKAAQSATASETIAVQSASTAASAATRAVESAASATASAAAADLSADRAEQAAKDAGYMFFHIDDNGHLIYERTDNVDVDFYLSDGHLFVRAA